MNAQQLESSPRTEDVAEVLVSAPPSNLRPPSKYRRRLILSVIQLALLVGILLIWQYGAGPRTDPNKLIDEFYVSKPSLIWHSLLQWQDSGILWSSIWVTAEETLLGFLIGAASGLAVGFILGVNRALADLTKPFITAVYSIPRLALVPLFILWFGIGTASKLALVVSVVFFLVFYATYAGVKDVDQDLIDKLRLMRGDRVRIHTKATLPSAATFIISGLSVSAPMALIVAITAEMISSNRGLGYLLIQSSGDFNTAGVFAGMLVSMVLGLVLMGAVQLLEHRLLRWKPDASSSRR
jgi:NitT/TauT family transport system permease protein